MQQRLFTSCMNMNKDENLYTNKLENISGWWKEKHRKKLYHRDTKPKHTHRYINLNIKSKMQFHWTRRRRRNTEKKLCIFFRTNCYLLTYYKTYLHENTHIVCRGPEMPKLFIRHNNMRTSRYWRCIEQCPALGIRPFIRQIRAFIKIYKLKICMVAGLWDHINFIFARQLCKERARRPSGWT